MLRVHVFVGALVASMAIASTGSATLPAERGRGSTPFRINPTVTQPVRASILEKTRARILIQPFPQGHASEATSPLAKPLSETTRASYRAIMLKSGGLSRTIGAGRNLFLAQTKRRAAEGEPAVDVPADTRADVKAVAERNYERAVDFVLQHAHRLELSRPTAVTLNRILTQGLVPEEHRGQPNYRVDSKSFYRWLASPRARDLARHDAVALADQIHRSIGGLDAFPDGNGRTGRLMADLALIKYGRAPAAHESQAAYFAGGSPAVKKIGGHDPKAASDYFRAAATRGQEAVAASAAASTAGVSRAAPGSR